MPEVLQHWMVPAPAESWILMLEQLVGVNVVEQPLVIALPVHVLPTVLIEPTFVVSQ